MIYLIRHGQTEFNVAGRLQGALDSPLTELGLRQAGWMGALLQDLTAATPVRRIVASPQGRAQHTARIVGDALGIDAIDTDPRLREVTLGVWDGLQRTDLDGRFPGWHDTFDWAFRSPDGDTYEAMSGRLAAWLAEARDHKGDLIAVSHGVASKVLRGLVLGLSLKDALALPIPQDAVFRIWGDQVDRIDCEPVD